MDREIISAKQAGWHRLLHGCFFSGHYVWHHLGSHCPIQQKRKVCRNYDFDVEVLNKSCSLIALIPARCVHGIMGASTFLQCSFRRNTRIDPPLAETIVVQIGMLLMRNEAELRQTFCLLRRLQRGPLTSRKGQLGASLRPADIH